MDVMFPAIPDPAPKPCPAQLGGTCDGDLRRGWTEALETAAAEHAPHADAAPREESQAKARAGDGEWPPAEPERRTTWSEALGGETAGRTVAPPLPAAAAPPVPADPPEADPEPPPAPDSPPFASAGSPASPLTAAQVPAAPPAAAPGDGWLAAAESPAPAEPGAAFQGSALRHRVVRALRGRGEHCWAHWVQDRGARPSATAAGAVGRARGEPNAGAGAFGGLPEPSPGSESGPAVPLPGAVPAATEDAQAAGLPQGPAGPAPGDRREVGEAPRSEAGFAARVAAAPPEPQPLHAPEGGERVRPQPAASRQVADAVQVSVARGGDRVSVQLQPEHLGKVHVVLAREEGGVAAHIRVETPQAQQALTSEVAVLRQALEARGVPLVNVSVELGDSDGQRRWGWQGGERKRSGVRLAAGDLGDEELAVGRAAWRPWGFEARV